MPNLFPASMAVTGRTPSPAAQTAVFGKSFRFDFDAGDFVLTPTGKVAPSEDVDAWLEWCKKALHTERYRYLAYSRNYGQEYDDLIARHLPKEATELELRRMTNETLMADPRTARADIISFDWQGDQCFFTCEIVSKRGARGIVTGRAAIR